MKNFKRTLAFISALSIVGTLSACSDIGEQTPEATLAATVETTAPKELSDEEKESVAAVDVGDDEKLENGKVRWLATYDINPAKGKPKDFSLELFETKYGGSIEWINTTWENRFTDHSTQVVGGDAPDMLPAQEFDTFP